MEEFVVGAKGNSRDMIKYLSFTILAAIGVFCIVLAIKLKGFSISLMENIGAACIIPPSFFFLSKVISWWFEPCITRRPKLARLIKNMKSELKIIGINLYDAHSKEESKDFIESMKAIVQKVLQSKGQIKFYILLLNPASPYFKQRQIEEDGKKSCPYYDKDITCSDTCCSSDAEECRLYKEHKVTIKKLTNIINHWGDFELKNVHFDCRLYDVMPKHSLIWVDKKIFTGPYFYGARGFKTPWIRIRWGRYQEACANEFKGLMEHKKTISIIKYP